MRPTHCWVVDGEQNIRHGLLEIRIERDDIGATVQAVDAA